MIKVIVVIVSTANMHHCFLSVRQYSKNLISMKGQSSQQPCEGVNITTPFHGGEPKAKRSEITQSRSHSSPRDVETLLKFKPYLVTDLVSNHYPILLCMLIMGNLETQKHTSKDKLPTSLHSGITTQLLLLVSLFFSFID